MLLYPRFKFSKALYSDKIFIRFSIPISPKLLRLRSKCVKDSDDDNFFTNNNINSFCKLHLDNVK